MCRCLARVCALVEHSRTIRPLVVRQVDDSSSADVNSGRTHRSQAVSPRGRGPISAGVTPAGPFFIGHQWALPLERDPQIDVGVCMTYFSRFPSRRRLGQTPNAQIKPLSQCPFRHCSTLLDHSRSYRQRYANSCRRERTFVITPYLFEWL